MFVGSMPSGNLLHQKSLSVFCSSPKFFSRDKGDKKQAQITRETYLFPFIASRYELKKCNNSPSQGY